MHCVDLGESFPTSIYLQKSASIQPRTSPYKFARSPRTDTPGDRSRDALPTTKTDAIRTIVVSLHDITCAATSASCSKFCRLWPVVREGGPGLAAV